MASVFDVAEEILLTVGPSDTFRLQKLVYYAQACHLARTNNPLFDEPIKAWVNGPVVPQLFQAHKKQYTVSTVGGIPGRLSNEDRKSVEMAIWLYGAHDSDWLVAQTHAEPPWSNARKGLAPDAEASPPISLDDMREYYARILNDSRIEDVLANRDEASGMTAAEIRKHYSNTGAKCRSESRD